MVSLPRMFELRGSPMLAVGVSDRLLADALAKRLPCASIDGRSGQQVLAVPLSLENLRLLASVDAVAASLRMRGYTWPGRHKPYAHQKKTAEFLVQHPRALVLNDIGTGKTLSALWAADRLMTLGLAKKCLIISPLSTLERVWGDALFGNFINRTFCVLHGPAAKRKQMASTADTDFYIVNHDGFSIVKDHLPPLDIVILDEAAVYRNARTRRFRYLNKFLRSHPTMRVWLMTGTPTPNAPTDAWALGHLVRNPTLSPSFTRFKDSTMMRVSQWAWAPRSCAMQVVKSALAPSIRVARSECLDLPPTTFQTRHVDLGPEQQTAYKDMLKKCVAIVSATDKVVAVNDAVLANKLLQISAGAVYSQHGVHKFTQAHNRLEVICELLEQTTEKVLVFAAFRPVVEGLAQAIRKRGYTVGMIHGGTSATERNKIFLAFAQDTDPRVIVAHPATMAHGLTLTAASLIIWHSPIASNEIYEQANGRIERIGKTAPGVVVHIEGSFAERKMYKKLREKRRFQNFILELVEEENANE